MSRNRTRELTRSLASTTSIGDTEKCDTQQKWGRSQKEFVICECVICYLLIREGFALGGPDRRDEDAGKLTIFPDQVLDLG